MTSLGSPEEWVDFIETQVPDILALVIETWEAMPAPAGDELEDVISEALCRALRQSRNRCDLPFDIWPQLVELDPTAGEDQGRMDIVFKPMYPREDIYFALECKRLHVRGSNGTRPYYAEYVQFGMLRFVRGQYARAVRHGGMLAFVLDGNTAGAVAGVDRNILANIHDLGMDAPGGFQVSTGRPADGRVRETRHRRNGEDAPFVIEHLFMAGDPNAPLRPPAPIPKGAQKSSKKKATKRQSRKKW